MENQHPYEPLSSELREELIKDAYTAPSHDELERILFAIDNVICAFTHKHDNTEDEDALERERVEALLELEASTECCDAFAAIRLLGMDEYMTSSEELETIVDESN